MKKKGLEKELLEKGKEKERIDEIAFENREARRFLFFFAFIYLSSFCGFALFCRGRGYPSVAYEIPKRERVNG